MMNLNLINYLHHLTIPFFHGVWIQTLAAKIKSDQTDVQFLCCTTSSHCFVPVIQDCCSCSPLVFSSLLGQRSRWTPGLAATPLFVAEEESEKLSFPGFPLGNLNATLCCSPRNLVPPRAQSGWCYRAQWCLVRVLSLLLGDPATG